MARSRNHCSNRNAKTCSLIIVDVHVPVNNVMNIKSVAM